MKRATVVAIALARKLFETREKSSRRNVEIHITEEDLAVALAYAFELGEKHARETKP